MIVSWFSAGCSSAVATKIALEKTENSQDEVQVIYEHIDDQHPDTMRFVKECEEWFGVEIEIIQSKYKTVDNVCRTFRFLKSAFGAKCTDVLKRRERKAWERENPGRHMYVWGFDASEGHRADRVKNNMEHCDHWFPLIQDGLTKPMVHDIMERAGIKRPQMYEMGYPNNNCIGCLKGGAGYWNRIRIDFPEVFKSRCELERNIGCSVLKDKEGNKIFLDELDPEMGREQKIILPECGIFCQQDTAYLTENPLIKEEQG